MDPNLLLTIFPADNYRSCHSRATRAIASHNFPAASLASIESDILTTVPSLHIFLPLSGPLHQDLKDMLCAWTVARSDEGLGYVPGAARIAGMLLLQMSIERAFLVMRNLMERHCVRAFYSGEASNEDVSLVLSCGSPTCIPDRSSCIEFRSKHTSGQFFFLIKTSRG